MATFTELVELAAVVLEGFGVGTIALGTALVALLTGVGLVRHRDWQLAFRNIRQRTGKVILLGLELLVGADIIRTVAEHPTMEKVAVLGGIVLIRTFLSFTISVELEGRWPWQAKHSE